MPFTDPAPMGSAFDLIFRRADGATITLHGADLIEIDQGDDLVTYYDNRVRYGVVTATLRLHRRADGSFAEVRTPAANTDESPIYSRVTRAHTTGASR